MIVEERYGRRVNAEEFSVEVKRGYLYCSPERSNLLYLIGRGSYVNRAGQTVTTSEVLRREPFSREMLEEMLDQKDRLKMEQKAITEKTWRMMEGSFDRKLARQIQIREGWALAEEDEDLG